jgi:S-layer protein
MAGLIDSFNMNQQLELIYIGYFNRSADSSGFQFWFNQNTVAQHNGQSASVALTNIANSFAPQAETEALYPFLATTAPLNPNSPVDQASVSNLISSIYQNLFGHAPDASGGAYWSTQILTGAIGLGAAVLAIANGATGADAIAMQNKITVALDFTTKTAGAGQGYSPNAAYLTAAKNVLAGVDNVSLNDASVTAAEAKTAAFVAGGAGAAQTFTLTTGVDNPSLTGNNTINGTFNGTLGTPATFTAGDTINGGATTGNTFNLVDLGIGSSANPTAVGATSVSGIQTVNILSGEAINANTASSIASFTGLTQLNITESNNDVASTITAAATANINVTDQSQGNATGTLSVQGGLNVAVATTEVTTSSGGVTVGNTTVPAGAVTITTTAAPTAAGNFTMGAITVYGGAVVSITQTEAGSAGFTTTGGNVTVYGGAATTSVTVDQTPSVASSATVAGVVDGQVIITDANYSGGAKLGVITTVSLDGMNGANSINDSALANLTVNDTAAGTSVVITEGGFASPATTLALSLNKDAGLTLQDSGNKYTVVNVTLGAAASNLTLTDTALTTLKISGPSSGTAGAFSFSSNAAALTSIDASGDNGGATFTDSWAGAVVKGGSGDDLVTLTAALTTASGGSINLGGGANSLLANPGVGSIGPGVTVDGGTGGVNNTISATLVNTGNAAGIKDFQILDVSGYGAGAGNGSLDASLLSTAVTGVAISSASTNGVATLLNLAAAVTVTDTHANDTSALVLTHAGSAINSLAINFAGTSTTATNETINTLTTTGDTTIAISSGGASTVGGYFNGITNLNETDNHLTTITITGSQALALGIVNGVVGAVNTNTAGTSPPVASNLTTIDGHAATGALTIGAGQTSATAAYNGLTILGGSGGDTIFNFANNGVITEGATGSTHVNNLMIAGSGATINDQASAGTDLINLFGVNDTANLGSGGTAAASTAVNMANATSAATVVDTVNFGSGIATVTDNLTYQAVASATSANTNGNLLALTGALHGEILAFAHPIANPAGALGALSSATILAAQTFDQAVFLAESTTANTVTWFVYANNTYIEDSGANPATTQTAEVVKIAGIVDLSHATITASGQLTFA